MASHWPCLKNHIWSTRPALNVPVEYLVRPFCPLIICWPVKNSSVPFSFPMNAWPGLRPWWWPKCLPYRIQVCCLPTHPRRRLSPAVQVYPYGPQLYVSGLNTNPASLIHLAWDSRYRVCPQVSLLPCWLNFRQVEFEPVGSHPLGNTRQFHPFSGNPKVLPL